MTNSLIITALAMALAISTAAAQDTNTVIATAPRLSVRPHEMVIGTETKRAGTQVIPGVRGYLYVPTRCLGKRRVPLLVDLNAGGENAHATIQAHNWYADEYGMILFAPNQYYPGEWDVIIGPGTVFSETDNGLLVAQFPEHDVRNIDRGMKYILQHYAIDPDRIALIGGSDGGNYAYFLGTSNLDIFSRIAPGSAATPLVDTGPKNPAAQFFISGGLSDALSGSGLPHMMLKMAQALRHEGNPVKTVMRLGGHGETRADDILMLNWIINSWANPNITMQVPSPIDSDPVLTVDALKRMTVFWTRFMQEPDSVLTDGRVAHEREIYLSLAGEPTSVLLTDMAALAARYPSVAADLQAAGLTAKQEDAYRTAMVRVRCAWVGGVVPGVPMDTLPFAKNIPFKTIAPTSVLGQNVAFRRAHAGEFKALAATGMWATP